jgi:hypothetical protein
LKPKIYEITLAIVKRDINDPSYVPNLNNLKTDIRQIYTNSKATTVTTNKSGEIMMAAIQPKGNPKTKRQFKSECRLCGAKGHKAADCCVNDMHKAKRLSNYKKRTPDKPLTPSSFQNPDNISPIITCEIVFYIISQKLQVKCCSAMYSLHSN